MSPKRSPGCLAACPPLTEACPLLTFQTSDQGSSATSFIPLELHRAVRIKEAMATTGLKRSHFWAIQCQTSTVFDETFPRRFKLGEGSHAPTVWWLHELVAWLETRAVMSRKGAKGVHA